MVPMSAPTYPAARVGSRAGPRVPSRWRVARTLLPLLPLLAPAAIGGCLHAAGATPPSDANAPKRSAHGRYRAAVRPDVDPIPMRRLHGWTLHLETADGAPVDAARIAIDGDMPRHGHGLPTRPRVVRALGAGDHRVEGMKFSMGGWWRVRFVVEGAAGVDTVAFNLDL